MNIKGIILNKFMSSKCVSSSVMTFTEFESIASTYSTACVVVSIDDSSFLFVDALKLFSEQPLTLAIEGSVDHVQVSTWDQLEAYLNGLESDIFSKYLTVAIVPRMWEAEPNKFELTPFVSNTTSQVKIISVENTIGLTAEYCDHNNFYERKNLGRSWNYPDISIINESLDDINFHNCIPFVNGSAFYPEVIRNIETEKEELVAHEAGKWLITSDWNMANVRTVKHNKVFENNSLINDFYDGGEPPTESAYCYNKNIVLMDFSSLGTISVIKLSDCSNGQVLHNRNELVRKPIQNVSNPTVDVHKAYMKGDIYYPECSYYEISFDLPSGTEMGIPIVCICGRFFYLHEDSEIRVSDNKISLTVRIERELLHNILLSNLQWFGKQNEGTSIVEERISYTLEELFKDTAYGNTPKDIARKMHEDNSIPFVIMLHTDKKLVCTKTEPIMTIGPDKFMFPKNSGGLLVNKRTREVVDYVRQFYDSGTLVETSMLRPINYLDRDIKQIVKPAIAFEFNKFKSKSKYKNFTCYEDGRDLNEYILIDFAYLEN